MGITNHKTLQVIALLGVASFVALGSTLFRRGHLEITKFSFDNMSANGPQTTQTRSAQEFDKVEAGEAFQVDITLGSETSVKIDAPSDLMPHITSEVRDGTLVLHTDINYSLPDNSVIRAHIVTPRLSEVWISGAGEMVVNGKVQGPDFSANVTGAAKLRLSASVDTFKLEVSGGSTTTISSLTAKRFEVTASGGATCLVDGTADYSSIEASGASNVRGEFTSKEADIQASGASQTHLTVLNSLKGEASGASSIQYGGNPPKVEENTSGASSIERF